MATFVHRRADKLGALALTMALVAIAAPATASPVMLTSPLVTHSSVFEFKALSYVAGPARPAIDVLIPGVRVDHVGEGEFDFSRAHSVALEWADATIHGPGSHAFGLVGLTLWLLWWKKLPALYS
jgi:hypothetical protein